MPDGFDRFPDVPAAQGFTQFPDAPQDAFEQFPDADSGSALGRIASAAGEGATEALALDESVGVSEDTERKFQDLGVFTPANIDSPTEAIRNFPRAITMEAPIRAGAAALDLIGRGMMVPIKAGAAVAGQVAREVGASETTAKNVQRDIEGLGETALIVAGGSPATVAARVPRSGRAGRVAESPRATPEEVTQSAPQVGADVAPRSQAAAPPEAQSAFPRATGRGARVQEEAGEFAGNINLNRIQSTEEARAAIRETAQRFEGFPEARRGTQAFRDTEQLAELVGMTPKKLNQRIQGQALNAEELFAARTLLVNSAEEVGRLAKQARGGSDAQRVALMDAINRHVAIQEQVSGATAEAGRALSQFRMLARENQQAEALKKIIDASGGADKIDDLAGIIGKLDDPVMVSRFLGDAAKARTSDMVLEVWINALLSGPTTHATNILSNSLVAFYAIPEAVTGAVVSRVTGSKAIKGREGLARTIGLVEGAKDGIRAGVRAFLTEEPTNAAQKLDVRKFRSIPSFRFRKGVKKARIGGFEVPLTGEIEIGGKQVRIPGRALLAADEFFKAIGYRQELNALAARQAMNEGLRGRPLANRIAELKNNPTNEMKASATRRAEVQTFTNPLGPAGQRLITTARDHPPLRIVMPFIRTPANIIKFAAQRSPFAPLFKEVRENLAGKNGVAAREDQIARIMLGSTVSTATTALAAEGFVTGGGPSNPKRRALKFADGWQPYSVRVGDTYYSYSRLEPLGVLMGVASDFAELNDAMTDGERDNIAALVMGSVSKNLVSKTWLRGPAELIEAVQDPDRYGERYIQNLVGTIVPTGVAQLARNQDPFLREARTLLDRIRSRVPGLREQLPMRRNVFGEPIELEGSVGPDLFSPIFQSAAQDDPAIAEMLRLDILPGRLRREIQGVELEAGEFEAYSRVTGVLIKDGLDSLIDLPEWREIPDDFRVELMVELMRKARDVARARTIAEFPDLALRIAGRMQDNQAKRKAQMDLFKRTRSQAQ